MAPTPLLFLHGLKGSVLRDARGAFAWLTRSQIAGLDRRRLALPLEWQGDVQARDDLRATEALRGVSIIPGLLEPDVYGAWLEGAGSWSRPFEELAYDWRRDLHEAAEATEARLDQLRQRHGLPAQVVAHSMGGLVALSVLNRRPDLFAGAVFCGSPIGGGVGFLEDMHCGPPVGLNSRVLDVRTLFSFPSVYTFFPENGDGLVARDGSPLAMNFFDAADWARLRLGLFALETVDSGRQAWLQKTLDRARSYRRLLSARPIAYPPVTVIASQSRPTLDTAMQGGPKSIRGWDFRSRPRVLGDARVRYVSALVPDGIPSRVRLSPREHSEILNDVDLVRDALEEQLRPRAGAAR